MCVSTIGTGGACACASDDRGIAAVAIAAAAPETNARRVTRTVSAYVNTILEWPITKMTHGAARFVRVPRATDAGPNVEPNCGTHEAVALRPDAFALPGHRRNTGRDCVACRRGVLADAIRPSGGHRGARGDRAGCRLSPGRQRRNRRSPHHRERRGGDADA